jgi:hypothetical protein
MAHFGSGHAFAATICGIGSRLGTDPTTPAILAA